MSTNGHTEIASGKSLFRIGEVSRLTDTKPFVLRYWETEFPMLQPVKSPKGHRLYRREDVETVRNIKRLLYDEGFTIAGARRHLHEVGKTQSVDTRPVNTPPHDTQLLETQLLDPQAGDRQPSGAQPAVTQHDAIRHAVEPQRKAAHFSREASGEPGSRDEERLFTREQPPAPSPISRKVLLDLRDSLRAFLTLLENE